MRNNQRVIILTLIGLLTMMSAPLYADESVPKPESRPSEPTPSIELMKRIIQARKGQTKQEDKEKVGSLEEATTQQAPEESPSAMNGLPTTLPAGEKGIQFSFNNAPYSTVFDFIERVTGLPIVGDRNIPGTLTYFSRKKMTVNEALSELNLLLKEKGVVVVRSEDRLQISKFPDVLRGYSIDFIGAESFLKSDVPSNQIVRVFFKVYNLPASDIASLIAEALPVNEVKLAAWKTNNMIQVVGLASQVKEIIQLTQKLDEGLQPAVTGLEFKVFKPNYISPSVLERMIRSMMPPTGIVGAGGMVLGEPGGPQAAGRVAVPRVGGDDTSLQIVSDDLTGTLAVRASRGQMQQISEMIKKLDTPEDEGNVIARTLDIKYGNVKSIEGAITEIIKQRAAMRGRSGQMALSVRGDEGTHSLMLAGTRTLVEQAEELAKELDQPIGATKLLIIPMKSARAEEVLRNVINPFYQSARKIAPVSVDASGNNIITWATGEELKELKELIRQLDEEASQGRGVPEVRVYQLKDVNVNNVAGNLQRMFAKQTDITFGADPGARTLIVAAPAGKFEQIEKVIEEMKTSLKDETLTRLVKVHYANVDQVSNAVRNAFGLRKLPTGEPRLIISPNVQASSILLTGDETIVAEAEKLIGDLDKEIQTASETRNYKLKYANSDDLSKMITSLYGGKDSTLKVVSEPWSNTLYISGGNGIIKEIEQLIQTADHAEPMDVTSNNIAFITLKTASASDAASQIESLLGTGKDMPSVDVSDAGNYLIVTGQPKQIERVRQLAEQIDKMAMQIPEILAVRPIQKTSAERLAQMLAVIVPQVSGTQVRLLPVEMNKGAQGMEKFMLEHPATTQAANFITIGVDRTNNTLIIRGRPRDIEEIDNSIDTLTSDIEDEVQFRTYTLKNASPTEVAGNLENMFNDTMALAAQRRQAAHGGAAQPGSKDAKTQPQVPAQAQAQAGKQRIRAIPLENTGSVVVRAQPNDFASVEDFIKQLDQSDGGSKVRIFKLAHARADAVAKNITELFKGTAAQAMGAVRRAGQASFGSSEVKVSYDLTSNSLMVSASRSEIKEIENLINTLDKPEAVGVEIRLIPLASASAEKLAPTIQNLLSQAEASLARQRGLPAEPVFISSESGTNSLIVAGSDRQYEQVKELVEKLESMKPAGSRRTYVLPLKNLDPNRAKQILDQLLPPGSRSEADFGTDRVIPNWREKVGKYIFEISFAQTSGNTGSKPATQPHQVKTDIPMSMLQKLLKARSLENHVPAKSPAHQDVSQNPSATTKPVLNGKPLQREAVPAKQAEQPVKTTVPGPAGKPAGAKDVEPTKEMETLANQIKGQVEITPVPEQNSLIIDASEEDYAIIQQLLSMLEMTAPQPKVDVFMLKNARAQEMANVLSRLFGNWPQPRGYPPITITPDTMTNSLIVSASPDVLEQISPVIKQLDSVEQAQQMDFKIYTLKNARASQLVPQLQSMLQQIMAARGVQNVPFNINADDRTNSIIVTAPDAYFDQIGKLISTLDAVPSFATVEFEIIRLKQVSADMLSKNLESLINPSTGGGQTKQILNRLELTSDTPGEKLTLDLEKPISIIADKESQSLLLLSTAENIKGLKKIVGMLDKAPLSSDLLVRVFPLQHASAEEMQKNLKEIFDRSKDLTETPGTSHKEGVPENPTGEALAYKVILASDSGSNTLIAAGRETGVALVEVLVKQLDKVGPGLFYPIYVFRLEYASAVSMVKNIQAVLDARVSRAQKIGGKTSADRASIVLNADDRTESLIVSASDEDYKMIYDLVKKLDIKVRKNPSEVIALKNANAEDLAEILNQYFEKRAKTAAAIQKSYGASPVIIPEARSNSLIVSTYTETMEEVKELVQKFDFASIDKKMQIAVIPLRSADANTLATAITNILNPSKSSTGLKQAVVLEFIRETPEGQLLIQHAVKDQVYIYGDKVSNLLIALAPEDIVTIIESLAKTIDSVAPTVEIKVIALENSEADQMVDIVKELFKIDKSSSSSATAGAIGTAAPAVGPAEAVGGTESAVSKIEKEVLAITSDARTNSIVLAGTSTYIKMIEDVVRKLDAKAIQQQETQVIPLKNADAEAVQKAISTLIDERLSTLKEAYGSEGLAPERLMENKVTIVADKDSRKIILQASPRYFNSVRKIIDELDEAPSQVMIQCLILQVTLGDTLEYGFEAVGQDLAFTKNQTAPGIGPHEDVVVGTDVGAAGTGLAGFTFSIRGEDLNILLRALDSDSKLEVLSRPQIMARDNVEASISIGQKVPYPTGANISSDTGNQTTSISYEDVGVILKVTPHINPDGYVNMEVNPQISSLSNSTVQISENLNATVFNNNEVETTVCIKDGETVVIGGLITTTKNHTENKVPILGDIPILGLLFKSLTDSNTQSEILVVLTPRIVDTVKKMRDLSIEERDLMDLLPANVRESKLLGNLRDIPPQLEGIVTPLTTTQPCGIISTQEVIIPEEKPTSILDPKAKIKAFMRTEDR